VFKIALANIRPGWKGMFRTAGAMLLELTARFLAAYDFYLRRKKPVIWDTIATTKNLKGSSTGELKNA
jgi:hypothetical protein